MRIAKLRLTAALLLALAAAWAGVLVHRAEAADKADKKDKEEKGPTVAGLIRAVDPAKRTVTLAVSDGKKEKNEKTIDLAKDARVILRDGLTKEDPGKEGALTDLPRGTPVVLQLSRDGKSVISVTAGPTTLRGGIKDADAGKKTITVVVKDETGAAEKVLTLAKGARILLNDGLSKGDPDKEGGLGDLPEGTPVTVRLSALDRKTVLDVRVQGRTLIGVLKGVDAGNNAVTVTVKGENGLEDKVLTVAKAARIAVEKDNSAQTAKLADLTTGARVMVQLSVFDKTTAVRVTARGDQ